MQKVGLRAFTGQSVGCSTNSPTRKGRSISRMENEELLDALRQRMDRDDIKLLYKLRSQTVELNFADLKEHRGLRRFHSRGLGRVTTEVAALVLRNVSTISSGKIRSGFIARLKVSI